LRPRITRELVDIGFHGYTVGGLAVRESQEVMLARIEETADRPRYLMGVGTPDDILHAVALGVLRRHLATRDFQ
jgi:queuine tRNA-ribosyltransferase